MSKRLQYVTYLCSGSQIFKNQSSRVSIERIMIFLTYPESHISNEFEMNL